MKNIPCPRRSSARFRRSVPHALAAFDRAGILCRVKTTEFDACAS